jgi:hypothetical protein
MNLLDYWNFIIPIGNMLFPLLTDEWLDVIMYFATEDHYSRQDITILFWKYLVDIKSEVCLNLFWEYSTSIENCDLESGLGNIYS